MYIWKFTFPGFTIPVIIEVIMWISAIVRIVRIIIKYYHMEA